jgi:ribonuclease E
LNTTTDVAQVAPLADIPAPTFANSFADAAPEQQLDSIVAEAVVEAPVAEAVVEAPVAEAVVEAPVAEAVVEAPVAEAVVEQQ